MSKKRTKFTPISNLKNSKLCVMPGRQKCECAGTKHELINNCTNCGRIVCAQERSGQCWFCGELVCTNEEFHIISTKPNKSQNLLKSLLSNPWLHSDEKDINDLTTKINLENLSGNRVADERKQRLLEFDRTSASRTRVIDDQKDYYETDGKSWSHPRIREELQKKHQELRDKRFTPSYATSKKYTLDFQNRQMIEETPSNEAAYELYQEPEIDMNITDNYETRTETNTNTDFLSFISSSENYADEIKKIISMNSKSLTRIQDKELHEIRDEGMCLSMHQPWASLLVLGIKKHEGRSWFTSHRGRLWIAATARIPLPETINECKQFYMDRGIDSKLFPETYPVGCLLGCVNIVDCLPEDDYIELYPSGESGSPYVFICNNPQELNLKFPLKGKHKIYKLEPHVHLAAKSGILKEE